jgi:hypothetical protein
MFGNIQIDLFYPDLYAFAVRTKFWCIQALNGRNAITKGAGMGYEQRILEHVSSLSQVIKEKVGTRVFGAFVIAQAALPFVSTDHINWLQSGSAQVLHVHIFHIPVYA